jgi:dihydroorotate dehydrogenase
MYRLLIRPILFLFAPEKAHYLTFSGLQWLAKFPFVLALFRRVYSISSPTLHCNLFGLQFPNPVGLAAGLDKNAVVIDELSNFGFGFIEIGTVTPEPQEGNEQPRLFRLPIDKALINRMGFNNDGMLAIAERLKQRQSKIIVGGNIGKNKLTPNENAVDDYIKCFKTLYPVVDYFVVNVSSPNTPGLRALQEKEPLTHILKQLQIINNSTTKSKPLLLKIAPDLTNEQLDDIVSIAADVNLDGLIATNTTISREGLMTAKNLIDEIGAGGLSGAPEKQRATEVVRYLRSKTAIPIIASGGVMTADDAIEKLQAGANLVQVYTGFIYEGPALVKAINKKIISKN